MGTSAKLPLAALPTDPQSWLRSTALAEAEVEYKCTDFYDAGDEIGFAWDDPMVAAPWPIDDPILSEKDRGAPTLAAIERLLPRFEGAAR